jgi:hypothetical protein
MNPATGGLVRRIRPDAYLFFFVLFALIVFLTHLPHLDLPFCWDEMGRFIPAGLDLFENGRWVPRSAPAGVHLPGLPAYLAGVWEAFGYSITATRIAMLLVASACVLVVFLLTIQLCRGLGGTPGFSAVLVLLVSPVFYMQAMLAQPDLPAMLFTVWALLWFLQSRYVASALVCGLLVLVRETGLVVPVVFAVWLWREGKPRQACWFLLPLVAFSAWLVVGRSGGHIFFGSAEFHPVRAAAEFFRSVYYLLVADFHWVGWIAVLVAARRSRIYSQQAWRVTATLVLAQVLGVGVLSGEGLERYLLPVLPLVYIAMAAAWSGCSWSWMRLGQAGMTAGLLGGLFVNPPYPFPYENNLAMVELGRLHQSAAQFLEQHCADRTITTAWPFSAALGRPEYGYVESRLVVREIPDFTSPSVAALDPAAVDIFVLYSRDWDSGWNLWRLPQFRALQRRYYGRQPQISPQLLAIRFRLREVAHWSHHGQWVTVFERRAATTPEVPIQPVLSTGF